MFKKRFLRFSQLFQSSEVSHGDTNILKYCKGFKEIKRFLRVLSTPFFYIAVMYTKAKLVEANFQ